MSQLNKLVMSSSPHVKADDNTTCIMADVLIALIPALTMSIFVFGLRSITHVATCIISCVVFELLYNKTTKSALTIGDLSAVVTGALIAFNLPVSAPLWIGVAGSFFAIIVIKMIYGGIGKNFVNPAMGARLFLVASWTSIMNVWAIPGDSLPLFENPIDVITSATPLAALKNGSLPSASSMEMALGQIGGCIGEVSALALILGGLYLLWRKVITPTIPLAFIGTVFVIAFLFPQGNSSLDFALAHILSGGVMLGAIFMATDYSTSPVSQKGQLVFGIGCGAITMLIRYFGSLSEGVSYSIVIMNALVFLIDKYSAPKRFGTQKIKTPKPVKIPKSEKPQENVKEEPVNE